MKKLVLMAAAMLMSLAMVTRADDDVKENWYGTTYLASSEFIETDEEDASYTLTQLGVAVIGKEKDKVSFSMGFKSFNKDMKALCSECTQKRGNFYFHPNITITLHLSSDDKLVLSGPLYLSDTRSDRSADLFEFNVNMPLRFIKLNKATTPQSVTKNAQMLRDYNIECVVISSGSHSCTLDSGDMISRNILAELLDKAAKANNVPSGYYGN